MQVRIENPELVFPVVKRAFYLAWKACGHPIGMGVWQDNPGATEDEVFNNAYHANDYMGKNHFENVSTPEKGKIYGDYVFGRMMKTRIEWAKDLITASDDKANGDYQSWAGEYSSVLTIVLKAAKELDAKLELLA